MTHLENLWAVITVSSIELKRRGIRIMDEDIKNHGRDISSYLAQFNLSPEERLEVAYVALRLLGVNVDSSNIFLEKDIK